jgi:hypothetical protein
MNTVRVDLRRDLLDELMAVAEGMTLTKMLNSALKVSLEHKDEIVEDAKDVAHHGNLERA